MASNKKIVVLAPNGRRQNVAVTPNTTILQIIEEVCKKQKLNPNEFDIKHHNKILDPTTSLQFSGLPNNATLELSPAQKIRVETDVTIGLQLENGTRLTGVFRPSQTLWDIIANLCPDEINSDNLVIIYMRNEIYGKEKLQETTLRAIGLTGGRAMIRLVHKSPDELKIQANVSTPLPSKPSEEKPYKRILKKENSNVEQSLQSNEKSNEKYENKNIEKIPSSEHMEVDSSENLNEIKTESIGNIKKTNIENCEKSMEILEENISEPSIETNPSEEDIIFLGERNALVFTLETAQSFRQDDIPDEFYDLTVHDARLLLKDIKRRQAELEDRPMLTAAQRELEKNTKFLRDINQYKRSVLRIQFPDRTVLQGTFKPLETVQIVMDFVKEYLNNPEIEFHLYTTPPKKILNPEARLVEVNCVPSAIVHFGSIIQLPENTHYLRDEILQKISSYNAASLAASKSRGIIINQNVSTSQTNQSAEKSNVTSYPSSSSSTSRATSAVHQEPNKSSASSSDKKIPKWFKPITK